MRTYYRWIHGHHPYIIELDGPLAHGIKARVIVGNETDKVGKYFNMTNYSLKILSDEYEEISRGQYLVYKKVGI